MANNENPFYAAVKSSLQQADIFRLDIIAPVADTTKRIFRTHDGQHGSIYFEGKTRAKVFSEEDLGNLLASIPNRTDWHVSPFSRAPDGQEEMVVTAARRFRYFVLASQTCDISGADKPPVAWGTILPIITLECTCKEEILPFPGAEKPCSIHEFLIGNCGDTLMLQGANEYTYGSVIRDNLPKWIGENSGNKKEGLRKIRKFLNEYAIKLYMYPLRENSERGIPESYIDFTMISTVPTCKLEEIKEFRIARLSDMYSIEFIQRFSTFFSRVATPIPMRTPPIKELKGTKE